MSFEVPAWIQALPAQPCPAHDGSDLSDNVSCKDPKKCWRVFWSNKDIPGRENGMKQCRCSAWTPCEEDFRQEAEQ